MAQAKAPKYKNTDKAKIHLQNFIGGPTFIDPKIGIANSFYSSTAMDHHTMPSQVSALPGMTDIGTGGVIDLIQAMDQDTNGVRYAVGNAGNVYRINTSNAISRIANLPGNGAAGMYYDQISDQVYIPDQDSISLYGQVTNPDSPPQFRPAQFGPSASSDPGCTRLQVSSGANAGYWVGLYRNNAYVIGGAEAITDPGQITTLATSTYNVPNSLDETDPHNCPFVPDIEPGYSIAVNITTPGVGNWTLVLHDSLNNQLASATIAHADVITGYNQFVFGSQVRVLVQQSQTGGSPTYHFHLYSSAVDGYVAVIPIPSGGDITAGYGTGDLRSVDFLWFAYRLVETNNTWHPMTYFNGDLCIGNGKYLATYDFSQDSGPTNVQFNRHQLIFKSGYEVTSLTTNNQYLVIGLERRSANSTRNAQDGQLLFWDSSTDKPNFIIDIPMGSPYGLQTFNNVTYFICAGSLFAWSGGQTVIKVRRLAYQNTDYLGVVDNTVVNPNMMAIRYNLLLMGYPSVTTNSTLNYGVYSWGAVEVSFPNSLGYSYQLSNSQVNYSSSNALRMGCIYNFVDQMYVSWQYTDADSVTHYGLDFLSNSSGPAASGDLRSLIYDSGLDYMQKMGLRMQVTMLPLPEGYTLQAFYSLDRGADILSLPASAGDTKLVFELDNARAREYQWGFTWTQDGATDPLKITGITMELASLEEETPITPWTD
jgi:hypothetical protein